MRHFWDFSATPLLGAWGIVPPCSPLVTPLGQGRNKVRWRPGQ